MRRSGKKFPRAKNIFFKFSKINENIEKTENFTFFKDNFRKKITLTLQKFIVNIQYSD